MATTDYNRWLRDSARVRFPGTIEAVLAIESVSGSQVSSGRCMVDVVALDIDRLKFASGLCFPISGTYRLSFAFEIDEEQYVLTGYVTGCSLAGGRYVYSVRLLVPEPLRGRLASAVERRKYAVMKLKERIHARYREHAGQALRPRRRYGAGTQ